MIENDEEPPNYEEEEKRQLDNRASHLNLRPQTAAAKPKRRRILVNGPQKNKHRLQTSQGFRANPQVQERSRNKRSLSKNDNQLEIDSDPEVGYDPQPAQRKRNWQADKPKLFKQNK